MRYHTIPRTAYPHAKIEEDSYDWWARHALKLRQVQSQKYDLIFIGDSITHFWHDEEGMCHPGHETVWRTFYGRRRVLNLGYGFDRPQNTLWHLENGEFSNQNPRAVVLNIGTNCFSITSRYSGDTPRAAFEGVKAVIEKIFELAPESRLILMEVFPRIPADIQCKIDELNALLRTYAAMFPMIRPVALHEQFAPHGMLNPALYMDEGCHPNAAGYRIWAEAMEPLLADCLDATQNGTRKDCDSVNSPEVFLKKSGSGASGCL